MFINDNKHDLDNEEENENETRRQVKLEAGVPGAH